MYNTPEGYQKVIRALSRVDRLTGTVTLPDGDEAPLTERKIGSGGLCITRKCVTGEELEFGGAVLSTLTCSLRTQRPRNVFYRAEIAPCYGVQLPDGTWFDLPLGIYTVAEAERSGAEVLITAYDNLSRLDKRYYGQILAGTPWQILNKICGICDVPFDMTEADVALFPNGVEIMRIDSTSNCKTYRDCVRQVAVMLAAFATANAQGALELMSYSKAVDVTLKKRHRYNLHAADYVCRYDRLTIENINHTVASTGSEDELAILGTAILGSMVLGYGGNTDEGLEMVIPDAACFNTGTEDTIHARCEAILGELGALEYTPASWRMPGDPSLEPGDRVAHITDEGDLESLVTAVTWKFRGKMLVESVGKNPYLIRQQSVGSELLLKDYNGDGRISLEDADTFRQMIVNEDTELTLEDDWNGDGKLDVGDVVAYRALVIKQLGSVPNTSTAVAGELVVAKAVENGIVKETDTIPIPYGYRGDCADADQAYLPGSYKLTADTVNCPVTDGVLIVSGEGSADAMVFQTAFSRDGTMKKCRTLWYGTVHAWSDM